MSDPRRRAAGRWGLILTLLVAWPPLLFSQPTPPTPPNIVVILVDDMGYSDIGCYGGEVRTPHLDQLAANGLRFTQFYNTGRCCPTRASLLTGLYPHQAGVGHMMSDRGYDGYRGDLNRRCRTIAEVLGPAGYRSYLSGKWHVTKSTGPDGPRDHWPRQRGFDRFYGTIHGAGSLFDPNTLTRDNTRIAADREFYYTDAITDAAVEFISDHEKDHADRPFFLYVAYTAPHWPMHALPEDIARYRGVYSDGWDAIRSARSKRMIEMGLVDESWALSPRDTGIPDWKSLPDREWFERRMEVYAAMIDRVDQGVGRLVGSLKKAERFENTLILFLADNGGCAEEIGSLGEPRLANPGAREKKAPAKGEPQPHMIPRWTRDGRDVKTGRGVMPGPADTYVAYGKGWANASNTPFRLYKHYVHEGGIATPLIAHWPRGIARRGELDHQPGHLIDIMATCVDLSGARYPTNVGEHAIVPLEGRSLRPAFDGKTIERDALFWEHEGNRAVRRGAWKLVARGARGSWELYDLSKDRTELHDLTSKHPEVARDLADRWQQWAERAQVLPLNPRRRDDLSKFDLSKRFVLKPGTDLDRNRAPYLRDRAFRVQATFTAGPEDHGVIVAQGGGSHGFSIYVDDQGLAFALRRDGTLSVARSSVDLSPRKARTLQAEIDRKGSLILQLDGQEVARARASGPMTSQPIDGLQVGRDATGAVGSYRAPFEFRGEIDRVEIKVLD